MARFRFVLAGLVTTVWVVGYALSFASGGEPPTEVSALMAIILGWAFAGQVRDSLKRKDDE